MASLEQQEKRAEREGFVDAAMSEGENLCGVLANGMVGCLFASILSDLFGFIRHTPLSYSIKCPAHGQQAW